ncbi:hypothetical protein [Bacteroides sedimenti]|uniref:Uncharacterized protein n=1 Tax=Bacteroides sedimenti TaxID=2136147 RepID=A0ABN6ZBZ0_9BACE
MNLKLIIINLILFSSINLYSSDKSDLIYFDLYKFLLKKGLASQDYLNENVNPKFLINIIDVIHPKKKNITFEENIGVYKFEYIGHQGTGYYILIKCNNVYDVYNIRHVNGVLMRLLEIKKNNPKIISDNFIVKCMEEMIDSKEKVLYTKIGQLKCNFIYGNE